MTQDFKRIDAYSLLDFAVELEKAVIAGYRVSLTNEHYPMTFGTHFTAGLVKQENEAKTDSPMTSGSDNTGVVEVDGGSDTTEQPKRGRKPKV